MVDLLLRRAEQLFHDRVHGQVAGYTESRVVGGSKACQRISQARADGPLGKRLFGFYFTHDAIDDTGVCGKSTIDKTIDIAAANIALPRTFRPSQGQQVVTTKGFQGLGARAEKDTECQSIPLHGRAPFFNVATTKPGIHP